MCFSLGVSLASAAILVPVGGYCINKTLRCDRSFWPFALLPLIFGVQQGLEAGVWMSLHDGQQYLRYFALGFLFFSHLFWLVWVPYASYLVESVQRRRKRMLQVAIFGGVCGITMYLPLLLEADLLSVSVVKDSIHYRLDLVYNEYLPRLLNILVYMLIIVFPLLYSSDKYLKIFGVLVMISMVISLVYFNFTYISVWCYFAAVISLYVCFMVWHRCTAKVVA